MRKSLAIIVLAVCIAATCFFHTNQVFDSKYLAEDPSVVTFPPMKILYPTPGLASFDIKILPENAIKLL
jgi:hypothetical protein